ncbi:hypothetical protein K504DRAFT_411188 [Pleomassaria siparia CBS 279.74]|uniref:Hemerythrin-like domain-containing protein n=1 Tax=Pleomassaria siparia CBS 279.74 TaxID=1314801 RepID=A0A6G1K436_9PLEO|nr:hypothetical protein K504DRAFT_411188 [Pleomassaria siparia CBS 279.74]
MSGIETSLFFTIQILAVAIFPSRYSTMATTAKTCNKPWADGPCPLVETPQYTTGKTDIFTLGATHMAHIHNTILRGYNSIYLQAPYVTNEDKADFVGYAQAWFRFVKSHHDDEELELFPKIEEVLGTKGLWDEMHKEHVSFLPGLTQFNDYLAQLPEPFDFDGAELCRIMSNFQDAFNSHFHNEIKTIASFADLPGAPKSSSVEAERASAILKTWGKKTVTKAGYTDVVPCFLLNLDTTYEDGMWANWPPMPKLVWWGLVNVAGAYHWGWWKFTSCNSAGKPRALFSL